MHLIDFANYGGSDGVDRSEYRDFVIANNTFMNPRYQQYGAIKCNMPTITNFTFENNLVSSPGGITSNEFCSGSGWTVRNNLWSSQPISILRGSNSIVSSDAGLANMYYTPAINTAYDTNTCKLNSNSPAINTGISNSSVLTDVFGSARPQRGAYDIGAHEY